MQTVKTDKVNSGNGGFSLIELMIVVAVIGILASVAMPGYNNYMRRMMLADGVAALADYRVKLEQYYQDNRNYGAGVGSSCGVAGSTITNKYFGYGCVVGPGSTSRYQIQASNEDGVGLGASGQYFYWVDETNSRGTLRYKGAVIAKPCWLVSGSEC